MVLKHSTGTGAWVYQAATTIAVKTFTTEFLNEFRRGGETASTPEGNADIGLKRINAIYDAVNEKTHSEAGFTGENISFRYTSPDVLSNDYLTAFVLSNPGETDKCIVLGSGRDRNQQAFILNDEGKTVERIYV